MSERAAQQLKIALRQLKNNASAIARQFQSDEKCGEVCQTLVETAATLESWIVLSGRIRVTVSRQPLLFEDDALVENRWDEIKP
jgi:DNA-binding FrmR family transcriptional regulator